MLQKISATMFRKGVSAIVKTSHCQNILLAQRHVAVEAKIAALGLEMPAPAVPKGNFVNFLVVGNLAYLSGHLPQVVFRCSS